MESLPMKRVALLWIFLKKVWLIKMETIIMALTKLTWLSLIWMTKTAGELCLEDLQVTIMIKEWCLKPSMQFTLIFGVIKVLHWISDQANQWQSKWKLDLKTLEIQHIIGNIIKGNGFLSIKSALIMSMTDTILLGLTQLVIKI